jgi:hypothetical protein
MVTKVRVRPLYFLNLNQKVRYNMISTFTVLFILLSPYVFRTGLVGTVITADSNATFAATNAVGTPDSRQGWTTAPNGRGTLSILWNSGFTMFLCSWSILYLKVPGPNDIRFQVSRRKLYMTTLSFLGPEFIFQIALGQWISGCHSVRDFHASGHTQWTMNHAFFADMGGFVLRTADGLAFPIDAKQLHYLVTEGYIGLPRLDKRMIADRK